MENNDAIKESDLIQLDGTIDKLIKQLDGLNDVYASMVNSVKKGADDLAKSMKSMSGATREGRKAIDDSIASADRLEKAQNELAFSMSETGKQVAWLKAQTIDTNKATVEQQRQLEAAVGSYNKLASEVKELTALYHSLTKAEMADVSYGGEIVKELREKRAELTAINNATKPYIESLSSLQKAEQKLAYWQSEQGKAELEVRRRIKEITAARKEEKASIDPVTTAQQKLASVRSGEMASLYQLNAEIDKETKLAKAVAKVNATVAGSYDRLSATYELTKLKMRSLDLTQEENKETLQALQKELQQTYAQMRKFQESTGVYSLGVGAYGEAFNGLSYSVQQVVRELPAATVSLNTFFLAISNNIPILVDELTREKRAFEAQTEAIKKSAKSSREAAIEIGKLEKPITKVIKSLLSWQTLLVVILTILPKYGEAIVDWIGVMLRGNSAAAKFNKALKDIRKELKNTTGDYGKNVITIQKLGVEYRALATEVEKADFVKNHADDWRELDVAIYDVTDAEKFFVDRTNEVREAFAKRAKAAAAFALAEKKYEEALPTEIEKQNLLEAGSESYKKGSYLRQVEVVDEFTGGVHKEGKWMSGEEAYEFDIAQLDKKITKLREEANVYYEIGVAAEDAAKKELGEYSKETGQGGGGKYKGGRDVTRYIEREDANLIKKSEDTITKLQISEFAKRRAEAKKNLDAETADLKNTLAENIRILEGYYKLKPGLTQEQKTALETMNEDILKLIGPEAFEGMSEDIKELLGPEAFEAMKTGIENLLGTEPSELIKVYNKALSDIALDEKIFFTQQAEELVQIKLNTVRKGSKEEFKLRKESIENQRKLELLNNQKLAKDERQDEGAINKKYDKQTKDVDSEENIAKLKITQNQIKLQLEAVKEGSEEEYRLRRSSIKAQYEIEIAENSLLAEEEQQSEEEIRDKYNKQLEDLEYAHQMQMIDIQKESINLRLGNVQKGSQQELNLLLQQIELERQAAIKANAQLAKELQQSEDEINAYYARRARLAQGTQELSAFRAGQTSISTNVIRTVDRTSPKEERPKLGKSIKTAVSKGQEDSRKREAFEMNQQIADINKQIELSEAHKLDLTEEQLATLRKQKAELEGQVKASSGFEGVMADIAKNGPIGGLLGMLGFDDEAMSAFQGAVDTVIENLSAIFEAEVELAEKELELQQEKVEAAQAAYDAELEARNNGYANNVETARKELEEERKKEAEKQKILEDAQKKQEALNTIIQTSSLITAAAQIWSSMSGIPIVGPALAGAAIAAMFASFIVAKVKAAQVSQQYGEGGLEFLEGGSHASGNDIPLGTKNSKGKNMKAEGGEAIAIINKKKTKKYRKELPAIVDSLNKGTFEDTYFNAFSTSGERNIYFSQSNTIDLSNLENDVRSIRKNNETRYYISKDGTTIMRYKNLRRVIRNS